MQFINPEIGAPRPRPAMAAPHPSPVPLGRGVWSRVDHDYPGHVIVEVWTGDEQCIVVARTTVAYYEFRRAALAADLDAYDPMTQHLKAV